MILVTGGAGFIGSHLVKQLLGAGEAVRVLAKPGSAVDHLPQDCLELVFGDIRDREQVKNAVAGCQQVYHLAADPNLWTRDPRDFDAINHQGTVHVLQEALAAGAQRVLHTSTESILVARAARLENRPALTPDELQPCREEMVGPYCLSKFAAEEEAFRLARAGAPVVVVNPTLPVGPGDWGCTPPTRLTLSALRGELPAYLDCRFNMIDARDVATGMMAAMARGVPGKRYVLGHVNLRLIDWLTMAAHAIGTKPPRFAVPYWLALLTAYGSEWWAKHVSGKMPQASVTGVRLTRYCMHFDPTPSLRELAITPRPLEDSLKDAIAWYRQVGWLR